MASELGGVWRTIRGRRVFIKDGEDLESAMKRSGKFKTKMNEMAVKGAKKEDLKEQYMTSLNNVSEMEYNGEITKDEYDQSIKNINDEYKNRRKDINGRETKAREIDKINKEWKDLANKMEKDYDEYGTTNWKDEKKLNELSLERDRVLALNSKPTLYQEIHGLPTKEEENYYQSKVFGTDVTKMDKQMKDLFGKDFKYDEDKEMYNSKEYAKWLSKSYNADSEYEDKITPKYVQDIDAGRYGNMSDEQAIKNWIDGGADIIYNDDAEKQLKAWGISVRNDDAYGTYKNELAKQLLPIYKSDKQNASLSKMQEDKGVKALDGSLEKDNKGRVVSEKEYNDFRQAYKDGKISKEDYRNDNYDAMNNVNPMEEWSDTTGTGLSDTQSTALNKMSLSELRNMANEYDINTKGKSKKQLLSALISMFNK